MKSGGGKQKGSEFEREVCKILSLYVTAGHRDDVLWRSAMSGGRATVALKKGKRLDHVAGDICAIHPAGQLLTDEYFIECKHYANLDYTGLLLTGTGVSALFWTTACEKAVTHAKRPMLILKQNRRPVMVMLPENHTLPVPSPSLVAHLPRVSAVLLDFTRAFSYRRRVR